MAARTEMSIAKGNSLLGQKSVASAKEQPQKTKTHYTSMTTTFHKY